VLAGALLAPVSSASAAGEAPVAKSAALERSAQAVRQYWTPRRMREATPGSGLVRSLIPAARKVAAPLTGDGSNPKRGLLGTTAKEV
jgi:hypothetical protein